MTAMVTRIENKKWWEDGGRMVGGWWKGSGRMVEG